MHDARRPDGWPARSLLAALPEAERAELLRLGSVRHFERGQTLIRAGEFGGEVYLILEGCVKVVDNSAEGYTVLLAVRMVGDLVGELAVLDGNPRAATVIAAAPTRVRAVSAAPLRGFLAEHPVSAAAVHNSVNAKFRQSIRHRSEANGAPAPLRLARVLHRLGETYGEPTAEGVAIPVPLSQADLGALIGATEQSVRRALSELRDEGLVEPHYRRPVIKDLDRLAKWIANTGGGRTR